MRHFGLTGYPLSHSFSAAWFHRKFVAEGITDAAFFNYPIQKPEEIPALFKSDPMLMGLSVTIPHKKSTIPLLHTLDPVAQSIGAVNCIRAVRSGSNVLLEGFNTDCYGFRESLIEAGGGTSRHALVLGTGGAASAVLYVLDQINCSYDLVSRRRAPHTISYDDLSDSHYRRSDLIINTTPLGMYPEIDGLPPIDYDAVGEETLLFDLVYNPPETAFLQEGRKRNIRGVNGLRMLELQAEKAWAIWNYTTL